MKKTARLKLVQPVDIHALSDAELEDRVSTEFLEHLVGYNARRCAFRLIESVELALADLGLKHVEFSVLSIVHRNPGITSRALVRVLNIQPPNLVGIVKSLETRLWIKREPHPLDGRAIALHIAPKRKSQIAKAELIALGDDERVACALTPQERETVIKLLQKVYL